MTDLEDHLPGDDEPVIAVTDEALEVEAPVEDEPGEAAPVTGQRPDDVPEKFWDAEQGQLRTDALLKSYVELERKLGQMISLPADSCKPHGDERFRRLLGIPEAAEDYRIEAPHELLPADPEINQRLHAAGFSEHQAQLVYDLAAEHVVPMIQETLDRSAAERAAERLQAHFGSPDAWRNTARQLKSWGEAHLEPEVMNVLASNVEGILAMHQMMQSREPEIGGTGRETGAPVAAGDLAQMMKDPRYWRERDPTFIARVTDGFKQLYSD